MKLRELMDQAFDEVWFCLKAPGDAERYFWSADYIGNHPEVMPDLEPMLDREFDEFRLVMRPDPEREDEVVFVPMVYVALNQTEEERKKELEHVHYNPIIELCKSKHSKLRKQQEEAINGKKRKVD